MTQRKRPYSSQSGRASAGLTSQEDDDPTFTQPSASQVQRGLENVTTAQLDQKAFELVQFILMKDRKKIPIRRADIIKHVVKEYRNVYPEIMKKVSHTFEQVFGFILVELDSKNHTYILINKLEVGEEDPSTRGPTNPKTSLLFVILSLIFMKGGVIKDSLIWSTLRKLRVNHGEKHDEFGDVKKVVTEEFVRQKYLEYTRIPHTEPVEFEFRWGPRADIEVSKAKILEVMGQLFNQDPQSWTRQSKEAQSSQSTQPSQQAGPSNQR